MFTAIPSLKCKKLIEYKVFARAFGHHSALHDQTLLVSVRRTGERHHIMYCLVWESA